MNKPGPKRSGVGTVSPNLARPRAAIKKSHQEGLCGGNTASRETISNIEDTKPEHVSPKTKVAKPKQAALLTDNKTSSLAASRSARDTSRQTKPNGNSTAPSCVGLLMDDELPKLLPSSASGDAPIHVKLCDETGGPVEKPSNASRSESNLTLLLADSTAPG